MVETGQAILIVGTDLGTRVAEIGPCILIMGTGLDTLVAEEDLGIQVLVVDIPMEADPLTLIVEDQKDQACLLVDHFLDLTMAMVLPPTKYPVLTIHLTNDLQVFTLKSQVATSLHRLQDHKLLVTYPQTDLVYIIHRLILDLDIVLIRGTILTRADTIPRNTILDTCLLQKTVIYHQENQMVTYHHPLKHPIATTHPESQVVTFRRRISQITEIDPDPAAELLLFHPQEIRGTCHLCLRGTTLARKEEVLVELEEEGMVRATGTEMTTTTGLERPTSRLDLMEYLPQEGQGQPTSVSTESFKSGLLILACTEFVPLNCIF